MDNEKEIKLTPKQDRFIQEYLIDFNATASAKRAGYSEKTAYSIGTELLKKSEIQNAIIIAKNETAKKTTVTKEYIIEALQGVIEQSKNEPRAATNLIKASAVLNNMLGFNEVKKIDITTGGERINWIEERTYVPGLPPHTPIKE